MAFSLYSQADRIKILFIQNKRRRRYVNCVSIKSTDPTRKNSYGRCIYARYICASHIYHIHISIALIATVTIIYAQIRHILSATVTIIHVNPMIEGLSCSYRHDRPFEKYIIITIMIMFDMLTANLKTTSIVSMVDCSGVVVSNASMVDAICVVVRSTSIGITCMKPF